MRLLMLTILLVGAVATPSVDQADHAPRRNGAHVSNFLVGYPYNWGLPMIEYDDIIPEVPVKEVSTKRNLKKKDPAPECEEHHRRWHLPGMEHCSDVEKAYDDKLDVGNVKLVSNKKKVTKKESVSECEERHRRLHLPGIEHCSDIDEAFNSLE